MKYFLISSLLLGSSILSGCMTSPTLPLEQRPEKWGALIQQQNNFYQISNTVYRSEQPSTEMIQQLKQQNIDIVINLRSRNSDQALLEHLNFQLAHVPINTWAIDRNDLLKVMRIIQKAQQNDQKVLVHCYHGSDRTGASIAMYRIIFENWSTADALNEMKHGGYGFHPIWINIEKIFTAENIQWIREQLTNPS